MKLLKWLSGLIANPATGQISHTKLWANITAACMTYKFIQTENAPEWLCGHTAAWSAATR